MAQPPPPFPHPAPQAAQTPAWPRPRLGRAGTLLAWLVIGLSTAAILSREWFIRHVLPAPPVPAAAAEALDPSQIRSAPLEISGRYAVGAPRVLARLGSSDSGGQAAQMAEQVRENAGSPLDRLRAVTVVGELQGPEAALRWLDEMSPPEPATAPATAPATQPLPASLRQDAESLRGIYTLGPDALDPARRQALIDRHGWFGRLAISHGRPDNHPDRAAALRPAERAAWVLIGFFIAAGVGVIVGLVLLVLGIVWLLDRRMGMAYLPPPRGYPTGPFLEAFAVYLGGMVVLSLLLSLMIASRALWTTWVMALLIPAAFLWPRWRGLRGKDLTYGLGWRKGRGWLREAGAGVVGYIAGLPVVAAGLMVTVVLTTLTDAKPTHPIQNEIGGGGWTVLHLYGLAAVWAPVVEETMFRGAFYHHVRRRLPWPLAAGCVAVLFAAIHPQGWTLIPGLGAIGFVLAGLREWRGSLVAPVVAHALNNGAVVTLMVLALW